MVGRGEALTQGQSDRSPVPIFGVQRLDMEMAGREGSGNSGSKRSPADDIYTRGSAIDTRRLVQGYKRVYKRYKRTSIGIQEGLQEVQED